MLTFLSPLSRSFVNRTSTFSFPLHLCHSSIVDARNHHISPAHPPQHSFLRDGPHRKDSTSSSFQQTIFDELLSPLCFLQSHLKLGVLIFRPFSRLDSIASAFDSRFGSAGNCQALIARRAISGLNLSKFIIRSDKRGTLVRDVSENCKTAGNALGN